MTLPDNTPEHVIDMYVKIMSNIEEKEAVVLPFYRSEWYKLEKVIDD